MIDIESAVEIFARGFSFTRSIAHPYELSRIGSIWHMKDAERLTGDYRREKFLIHNFDPKEAVAAINALNPSKPTYTVIHPVEEFRQVRAAYNAEGLRARGSEGLFVHDLAHVPERTCSYPIRVVSTSEEADAVSEAAGGRQIKYEHLGADKPVRLYAAFDGDSPVGWVRSVYGTELGNWVSNLWVLKSYRRQGIGAALMTRMLQDDKRLGVRNSVLSASRAGSFLYPSLGYEKMGVIQVFLY